MFFTRVVAYALLTSATLVSLVSAQTPVNQNMNVKIQILAQCAMTAPADLDFGTHGVLAAPVTATTTLTVTCTNTTPYAITMGQGGHYDTTSSLRRMAGGTAEFITYGLFRDSSHAQPWGATTGAGGDVLQGTGSGTPQSISVYGRVPAQNTPSPSMYTDIVAVTLTY